MEILTISDKEYETIRQLVYEKSRINLGANKKELVTSRLSKRLKDNNIPDFKAYCQFLNSPAGAKEISHLIDAISTNHTMFFREMPHFDFLKQQILPTFVKQAASTKESIFKIWSAATSSGEEPYSIAITLQEFFKSQKGLSWYIEGTDISNIALGKAHAGVFLKEKLTATVPQHFIDEYFKTKTNPKDKVDYCEIIPALRNNMRFSVQNLLKPPYPFGNKKFHLIFCRNVMIYFDRATQEELVNQLTVHLHDGGYLFIGHAESLANIKISLKMVQPAIYQKQ